MPATPGDIARYTTDGTAITSPVNPAVSDGILAAHIDARSSGEIEMFYVDPADAQYYLDERFFYQSMVNPPHVGVEVQESLDLGGDIPLIPVVPSFRGIDDENDVRFTARTRAYGYDMNTDRFSVELLG